MAIIIHLLRMLIMYTFSFQLFQIFMRYLNFLKYFMNFLKLKIVILFKYNVNLITNLI